MPRQPTLLFLLVTTICISVSNPVKSEVLTGSGLVDTPTGRVLQHGIFEVGTYLGFRQTAMNRTTANLGDAVAIRLNFGLFDRLEVGITHLWDEDDPDSTVDRTAHLKLQLLKEPEAGLIPSVAIGVEKLGNNILTEASETPSAFLAVSKTFNLPRIHLFSLHVGIGTQRFAFEEGTIGVFGGLSKEFRPAFARGDIAMRLEFDRAGVNAGLRYITSSGFQVALGAETLNNAAERRYLAAAAWTNAQVLEQIDAARRLILRARSLTNNTTETPPSQ